MGLRRIDLIMVGAWSKKCFDSGYALDSGLCQKRQLTSMGTAHIELEGMFKSANVVQVD